MYIHTLCRKVTTLKLYSYDLKKSTFFQLNFYLFILFKIGYGKIKNFEFLKSDRYLKK